MVRCFQEQSSIQYYEDNPAARDVLLTAIQGSSRPTALATPASDEAFLSDPPYRGISPVGQSSGDGGPQYRTYREDVDDLETGRTEESLLAAIGDSVDGHVAQSRGRPLRQAAQSAAASISDQLLGTATYRPRKRKHVSAGRDDTDGLQSTAPGPADLATESPGPELGDPASLPISGRGPVPLPSALAATPPSTPGTVGSS